MAEKKVFVAGHNGMVGKAIVRLLKSDPKVIIVTKDKQDLNLLNQSDVYNFFNGEEIDEVYLAAAKVGGIWANNQYPADFIYENLMIQSNIIHSAHLNNVQKILFLGSSCIYPKFAEQPIKESALLTGELESTNAPYAIAKIAGIKLCESYNRQFGRDYRCVMPTNLYGYGDNYHPENSHVVPALIRRFVDAVTNNQKEVIIWGSGTPKREFMYVDDMAEASIQIMNLSHEIFSSLGVSHINIGVGEDISIGRLAKLMAELTGFKGHLIFDTTKPDGTPRKVLDISILKSLGITPKISLRQGLKLAIKDYRNSI